MDLLRPDEVTRIWMSSRIPEERFPLAYAVARTTPTASVETVIDLVDRAISAVVAERLPVNVRHVPARLVGFSTLALALEHVPSAAFDDGLPTGSDQAIVVVAHAPRSHCTERAPRSGLQSQEHRTRVPGRQPAAEADDWKQKHYPPEGYDEELDEAARELREALEACQADTEAFRVLAHRTTGLKRRQLPDVLYEARRLASQAAEQSDALRAEIDQLRVRLAVYAAGPSWMDRFGPPEKGRLEYTAAGAAQAVRSGDGAGHARLVAWVDWLEGEEIVSRVNAERWVDDLLDIASATLGISGREESPGV